MTRLTINITKYHLIFVLTALIAIFVKLYSNNCLGTGVQLEYQTTKDRYWTRSFQLAVKYTFKNLDGLSSVVAECRAHCQGTNLAEVRIDVGECTSNPVLIMDNLETDERKLRSTTSAKASIPCFLKLNDSVIPGANKGVFTDVFLNKGFLFGPYTGFIKGENSEVSWYTWKIDTTVPGKNATAIYMDGDDEIFSNWLRWVNSARFAEEQNMIALSFNQSIYYYLYKDVRPGEELLVWYGRDYARYLAISTLPDANYDWSSDFAPPKSLVVCPSCHWSKDYANLNLKGTFLDHDGGKRDE